MKLYNKFKNGLFTKGQFIVGVTLTMVTTSALVYAYQLISLNIFTDGQTISAAQVNQNFNQINEALSRVGNSFEVGMSANQTIPTSTTVWGSMAQLNIDTIVYDDSEYGYAAQLVGADAFTIVDSGFYQILATSKLDASTPSGTTGYVSVSKNAGAQTLISMYVYSSNVNITTRNSS
ncbi:MAG: hypothetical protein HON90_04480, partial [Halobacteriovoraceae bacterium]|nr:hypothetical protein [Halobacteriovoraceae bacterium]